MNNPPVWSESQLADELAKSVELFRKERLEEDPAKYGEYFDQFQGHVETLLESTQDLKQLEKNALDILLDSQLLNSVRYISGPPVSEDDLETIADAMLKPAKLKTDPGMVERIIQVIRAGLDRRRFPWVARSTEPTEAERQAAVIASAALLASQRIDTDRRNEASKKQQDAVVEALVQIGMTQIRAKVMPVLRNAPNPGEFCKRLYGKSGFRKMTAPSYFGGIYAGSEFAPQCVQ